MSAALTQRTPAVTEVISRGYLFPIAFGTLDPCTFKGANCTTTGTMAPNTTITRPAFVYRYLFPPFCSDRVQQECYDVKLPECGECSNGGAAAFMTLVALLGLAIVVGNLLVLAVVGKRKSKGKLENMDLHRTSLAVADLLSGIQILVVTSYNFHFTLTSTPHEIGDRFQSLLNTPAVKVGAIFFNLTFIASIYNLAYLAAQRLYAFVRPIDYKLQRKQNINLALCFVWLLSIVFSTAYAWFPEHFNFSYSIGAMIFYPSMPSSEWNTPAILVLVIFLLVPYVLTTCFIIASAFIVHSHLKRSAKSKSAYAQSSGADTDDSNKSNEIGFFVSTVMMQVGFTVSVLPCAVVVILLYASSFNAGLYANAFVICLYISMLNSLVNVLVYSIRDSKFRSEVTDILAACCCCCGKDAMQRVRTSSSTTDKGFSNSTGVSRTGRYTKKSQSTASEPA